MKAIVQERYGAPDEVLELQDTAVPSVGKGEVLVRVRATTVAGDDWHLMRGLPYVARMEGGLRRPKRRTPGLDVAGTVEMIGPGVTRFHPGDEVFGWTSGAFAEYAAVSQDALVAKPAGLSFEEAATVPVAAFTALQGLRDKGGIGAGQKVLILGASGGVGTFAVQIAKASGAEVTGVASTQNLELVRSLGADHVIDYTIDDVTQVGQTYDLILDMVARSSLSDLRRILSPTGTLVMIGSAGRAVKGGGLKGRDRWFMGTLDRWLNGVLMSLFSSQKLRPLIHKDSLDDLETLKEMIEAGQIRPVISASYPLSEVRDAIRHFEAGHASGKIVITV
jgi:NADPH:quinone reductase-like Zn-dependent oxidoreductase